MTRKAFTNEALLHKLEKELARIERDVHDIRTLIFAAFQRKNGD